MKGLLSDLKYSLRTFTRQPMFSIAAIATLALGIGASVSVFSVVNVLLKAPSFPDPDHIVQFLLTSPSYGSLAAVSIPKFSLWREQTDVFQDVSAYDFSGGTLLNLTSGSQAEQIKGLHVTADYFRLFGVRLEHGRTFAPGEDSPNGPHADIVSNGLWRRRFNGDPDLIGKPIQLGGEPYAVVGILARSLDLDPSVEIWIPFQFDLNSTSAATYFKAAGRLKSGVTLAMAKAWLQLTSNEFRRKFPGDRTMGARDGFSVQPTQEALVGDSRSSLLILTGAVAFVVLIACANVGNLFLVRAEGRTREMAVRASIGASRGHILRQLLTDSVLVSLTSGALGFVVSIAAVHILLAINPGSILRVWESGSAITMNWRVFAFTAVGSLATGVLVGLRPAMHFSRTDLSTLNQGSGYTSSGFRDNRTYSILIIIEVSSAIVLLLGAAYSFELTLL